MKTSVLMKRELMGIEISQNSKNEFLWLSLFVLLMGSIIKEGKENSNYFLSADCDFCIFGKDCCAGGCDILYGQQDCK